MGVRKVFLCISAALVVLSFAVVGVRGLQFGIEFVGGTSIAFHNTGDTSIEDMRAAFTEAGEPDEMCIGDRAYASLAAAGQPHEDRIDAGGQSATLVSASGGNSFNGEAVFADFTGSSVPLGMFPYAAWAKSLRDALTRESERMLAVSYTHLDVYKRQVVSRIGGNLIVNVKGSRVALSSELAKHITV